MQQFSEFLKQTRKRYGLTQDEAAIEWEIPLDTLRSWEQGRRAPKPYAEKALKEIIALRLASLGKAPLSGS